MSKKTAFAQTLRKLRENKKISQKNVSYDLGISQALLSHYEKGVRECGLGFLIKAAKYYGVTTDYLLGMTCEEKNMADCTDINNIDNEKQLNKKKLENNYIILCKNLIKNITDYIFDNMKYIEQKRTAQISGEYMILSIYSLYKYLTDENEKKFAEYEEIEAAKLKLLAELKQNKQYLKDSLSNEYVSHMIKSGDNIISRI